MREERADQAAGRVPVRPGSRLTSRLTRVETEAIPEGRDPTRPEAGAGSASGEELEIGEEVELATSEKWAEHCKLPANNR